jgi:hypothetical protein
VFTCGSAWDIAGGGVAAPIIQPLVEEGKRRWRLASRFGLGAATPRIWPV